LCRKFLPTSRNILAPRRKPSKHQQAMAQSVDELNAKFDKLSTRFESFQDMMRESLEKWSGLEAWWRTADESFGSSLEKTASVAEDQALGAASSSPSTAATAPSASDSTAADEPASSTSARGESAWIRLEHGSVPVPAHVCG